MCHRCQQHRWGTLSWEYLCEFLKKFETALIVYSGEEIFTSQGGPPVSKTQAANFATSFASVVDTGGKFATGVNDTGDKQWEQYKAAETLK
jgi:hypothetical protein